MKIGEYEVVVIDKDTVKVGCETIRRGKIEDILKLMDEWKPAPKFQVGDFVRVIAKTPQEHYSWLAILHNKVGKVVADVGAWQSNSTHAACYGVEFAERIPQLNGLQGRTKDCHGYWLLPEMLEKVD